MCLSNHDIHTFEKGKRLQLGVPGWARAPGWQLLWQGGMLTGRPLKNPWSLCLVQTAPRARCHKTRQSLSSQAGVWMEAVLDRPVAFALYFMLDIDLNSSVSHMVGLTWLKGWLVTQWKALGKEQTYSSATASHNGGRSVQEHCLHDSVTLCWDEGCYLGLREMRM